MKRPIHGGNLVWAAHQVGCPASCLLDFSASINPLGPPECAIAAIQEALGSLTSYPDPDYTDLREALSKWHQVPSEWILPGNGAAELLTWACRELAQLEVTYLPTPAFSDYQRALRAFGAKIKPIPLILEEVAWQLQFDVQGKTGRGLLINNPHNPTGKLLSRAAIVPLLEQFSLVVIDEAFMDFLLPSEQQSLITEIKDYPNLVIVRSLTKFYSLPGLRLGYAIAHPNLLRRWQQWRDPWPVNLLAAAAATAVVKDTEFQQKTWNWLIPSRKALFEGLSALKGLQPIAGTANFLLVKTQYSSSQLQEKLLLNNHILIRDCLSFPELGDRYFRVAVRTQADNQRLLKGLASAIAESSQPEKRL